MTEEQVVVRQCSEVGRMFSEEFRFLASKYGYEASASDGDESVRGATTSISLRDGRRGCEREFSCSCAAFGSVKDSS